MEWHRVLLACCKNQRLLDMIDDLKGIAFRYEYAFMQELELVATSIHEHGEIVSMYFEKGPAAAVPFLEKHWESSMKALLARLQM